MKLLTNDRTTLLLLGFMIFVIVVLVLAAVYLNVKMTEIKAGIVP